MRIQVLLGILLVVSMLGACGTPAPTQTPAPTPTNTPEPTPTPTETMTPAPTATPTPTPTNTPEPTNTPTATPIPTETPIPPELKPLDLPGFSEVWNTQTGRFEYVDVDQKTIAYWDQENKRIELVRGLTKLDLEKHKGLFVGWSAKDVFAGFQEAKKMEKLK
jgi:hypothetical protein